MGHEVYDRRTWDCEHASYAAQSGDVCSEGRRGVLQRRVVHRQCAGGGGRQHGHGPRVQREPGLQTKFAGQLQLQAMHMFGSHSQMSQLRWFYAQSREIVGNSHPRHHGGCARVTPNCLESTPGLSEY